MSETRHSPGPWSLPHFARPDINCQCGYVLTDGMMGAVCQVFASGEGDDWVKHGDNPKFEEAIANAYLIAAAPDLLAALVAMLPENCGLDDDPSGKHRPSFEKCEAARAAIKKASAS